MDRVNCNKCKYFYITWDPRFPRGCKYFGFKSADMPSVAVYTSTGLQCIVYEEKEEKSKQKE